MNSAVILLGSNLGNRYKNLSDALTLIKQKIGELKLSSKVYETAPWGNTEQPSFLNQVVEISTAFNALTLMKNLLAIEQEQGRIRREKWSPRIIDLDVLYFNEEIIQSNELTVPHPCMHERRFVLVPLNEILPNKLHPILKKMNSQLLKELKDQQDVRPVEYSIPENN
jgi:2-amino-4-hydroxy-6-hydroxymethyldihydropteridine diphosphokinase